MCVYSRCRAVAVDITLDFERGRSGTFRTRMFSQLFEKILLGCVSATASGVVSDDISFYIVLATQRRLLTRRLRAWSTDHLLSSHGYINSIGLSSTNSSSPRASGLHSRLLLLWCAPQ